MHWNVWIRTRTTNVLYIRIEEEGLPGDGRERRHGWMDELHVSQFVLFVGVCGRYPCVGPTPCNGVFILTHWICSFRYEIEFFPRQILQYFFLLWLFFFIWRCVVLYGTTLRGCVRNTYYMEFYWFSCCGWQSKVVLEYVDTKIHNLFKLKCTSRCLRATTLESNGIKTGCHFWRYVCC